MILFAIAIVVASSTDCLTTGLSYGCNNIILPIFSQLIITLTCTLTIVLCIILTNNITIHLISPRIARVIGAIILIILGLYKLSYQIIRTTAYRKRLNNQLKSSLLGIDLIVNICNQPKIADIDNNKNISPVESILVATALSIDGIAIGVGTGLAGVSLVFVALLGGLMLIGTYCSLKLGMYIGANLARKFNKNLGWLSGVLLMLIGIFNLIL